MRLRLFQAWLIFAAAAFGFAAGTNQVVRWRGRVSPVPGPGTNLVFRTEQGSRYSLKRDKMSAALFLDTNLLSRALLLTGRPEGKSFEITGNLHSIKEGQVNELYYYCDICSISSSIPGLCQCCRQPSRLVEEPSEKP